MRFHHQSIESKELKVRQIQAIQTNTIAIYVFVNIIKNHFVMSTLFLLSKELLVARSTRRDHSSSRRNNVDDESSNDENDENNENNEDDENDKNDETQTKR
jgi:hypothetical protein